MSKRMVDLKVEDGKIASIDGHEVGGGTAVEANPQEEATQQLDKIKIDNIAYSIAGGGGGGGSSSVVTISIASSKAQTKSKAGGPYSLAWSNTNKLEANTAYEVGDIARVFYSATFGSISVETDEICDIVGFTDAVTADYRKLQFGDVVLVLTGVDVTPASNIRDNKYIDITASYYLTYVVVKAGTTGTSVDLDTSKFSPQMQCIIHRLSARVV